MRSHASKFVRTLVPAGAVAVLLVLSGGLYAPAVADTASCQGVLSGADSDLQKSLVSITPGANAGDYTVVYSLESSRPAGVYRVRDCAFIDTGAPGYTGEPFVGTMEDKDTTFVSSNGGSTATFTQVVSGVEPNDQLCDRAAMSGTTADQTGFTDKSNLLCITPNNPPVIPESALALTLPLAAVGAVGLVLLVQRRRSATAATSL